jgi:hypothetical protein
MLLKRFMMFLKTQSDAVFIESMIACFAAPVARGFKCGSLLNLHRKGKDLRSSWVKSREAIGASLSLKFAELLSSERSILLFIYKDEPLLDALRSEGAREILLEYGYDGDFDSSKPYINEMISRFAAGIPHEIGLFLGYPHDDVRGFIENKGKNAKFSGYWKVYGDESHALKKFEQFKKAEAESAIALLEKAGYGSPAEAA